MGEERDTQSGTETPRASGLATLGSKAIRETPDGVVYVGFVPHVLQTVPGGGGPRHPSVGFDPVSISFEKLRALLDQQEAKGRMLILIGQVFVVPESATLKEEDSVTQ